MPVDPAAAAAGGDQARSLVRTEVADGIATITLDRPEALNALTIPMKEELLAAFRAIGRDRAVRAVVLTGAGRAFCAGQDLKERLVPGAVPLVIEVRERYNPIIRAMRGLAKPIIGAINGVAAGAGASLAMACDVRIAGFSASFGQPEINLGIIPGGGGSQRLTRVLGRQRAMELVLTGRRVDAAEARELGFVNRVVEGGGWLEAALALAGEVAEQPPLAARLAKQAVIAAEETSLSAGLEEERRLYELAMATEDRVEGTKAFLEKREPKFEGK